MELIKKHYPNNEIKTSNDTIKVWAGWVSYSKPESRQVAIDNLFFLLNNDTTNTNVEKRWFETIEYLDRMGRFINKEEKQKALNSINNK